MIIFFLEPKKGNAAKAKPPSEAVCTYTIALSCFLNNTYLRLMCNSGIKYYNNYNYFTIATMIKLNKVTKYPIRISV